MGESTILNKVKLLSRGPVRLFRNNVGAAWMGKSKLNNDGSRTIFYPRRVEFGLAVGSSDTIGFKTVEITPDMVGQKIAIFVAIETKDEKNEPSPEQKQFIKIVQNAGGFAGVARSVDDAKEILKI